MEFTYKAYEGLVKLIKDEGYEFCGYHNYGESPCVIMRHDIDLQVKKAYEMSLLEDRLGIKTTYFALLNTDFYNLASNTNSELLKDMIARGHEIGLHFDEARYPDLETYEATVEKEAKILSEILEHEVTSVSMHRPSKKALTGDWKFEGMVNTYGKTFFNDFKYLSDSRMNWRENPIETIKSHEHTHIQIVTHPFGYNDEPQAFEENVKSFIMAANLELYDSLLDNIRDLNDAVKREEIC